MNLSADPDNVLIHWLPPYSMDIPENTTWFNVKISNGSEVLIIDENVTTHFTCIRKQLFEPGQAYSCIITSWNVAGKGESVTVQVMIPGPTPTMLIIYRCGHGYIYRYLIAGRCACIHNYGDLLFIF